MNNKLNNFLDKTFQFFKMDIEKEYNFSLEDENQNNNSNNAIINKNNNIDLPNTDKIYQSIDVNIEYLKAKYNIPLNSDIILREFNLYIKNKQYKAFLLFIDGMIDTNLIDNFVLKPLMLKNKSNSFISQDEIITQAVTNNITVRKVKKTNTIDYIFDSLLPQNSVTKEILFSEIIKGINSGNCALFIDTLDTAFNIDVKGFKQRSVDTPNNENIIKGAQEAFVENIRINTSLLRRIINNENLTFENIELRKYY